MQKYQIHVADLIDPLLKQGKNIISVTGSGGKTTLIRRAALYYGESCRVGVAASTKMYLPDDTWQIHGEMPQIVTAGYAGCLSVKAPSVVFYTDQILPGGKIHGISPVMFQKASCNSDLLLIEADGSACKPLKGWRADEPVIIPETMAVIGILPLHCFGKRIDEKFVHRLPAFTAVTGLRQGDIMTEEAYIRLILHEHGLFGHASCDRILLLNRVCDDAMAGIAEKIIKNCRSHISQYAIGYLKDE